MRVSIIIPVINETFSFEKTVNIVMSDNGPDIHEIIIVIAERTSTSSLEVIEKMKLKYPNIINVHKQSLPYLGGALREAFNLASGDYTLLMASDLETDPNDVKNLIGKAKEGYDIVATSRWYKNVHFKGYNPVKLLCNKLFQWFFKLLYRTTLTDLTFGFRIYKSDILKKIKWEELRHPFLLESIVKPLRLGYKETEIPTNWCARPEGKSQNTFMRNFAYFKIGIKTLFLSKKEILRSENI